MKSKTENIVKDLEIYSKGLSLAIKKGNFHDASKYVTKISNHLHSIKEYLVVKDKLRIMKEYNLK